MKKFVAKFLREFEVEIQAESTAAAAQAARKVLDQFPKDTVRVLSVIAEGAVIETPAPTPGPRRGGPPTLGGSPATPTIKVPVLADQIAEAA